jgi:hypothetical protein
MRDKSKMKRAFRHRMIVQPKSNVRSNEGIPGTLREHKQSRITNSP